jgi:hypothetical protein
VALDVAGGAQTSAPDPLTLVPKTPETLIDISTAPRPADESGKVMDDLAYLNHLVFTINEGKATYTSDYIPQFKNEAEKVAYEAAMAKFREPIKDIEELVRLKVVKALPQPPAGAKYAISEKTGKVELVRQ